MGREITAQARWAALNRGEPTYTNETPCEVCGTYERATRRYQCIKCNLYRNRKVRGIPSSFKVYPRKHRPTGWEPPYLIRWREELWRQREDAWGFVWRALETGKDVFALRRLLDVWQHYDDKLRTASGERVRFGNGRLLAELLRVEEAQASTPSLRVIREA